MAFIEWTDANRVGIAAVDEEHRRLFEILNKLHAAMTEAREQDMLRRILAELIGHAVVHFQTEEDLYTRYEYPGYEEHKKVHDALTETAMEVQDSLREDGAVVSPELLEFLRDWLVGHTLGLDKEMGKFFNARGVR